MAGVYFALLTIAFAEFTRILFDHFAWVGSSSGLFLPVANPDHDDLVTCAARRRCSTTCCSSRLLAVLALSRLLLRRRIGYYWQAIREDEEAAQALGINVFRYKLAAVALSAALTAVAGTFYAFYDNNLYPDTIFATGRSIEIILPADHRRARHAVRPDPRRLRADLLRRDHDRGDGAFGIDLRRQADSLRPRPRHRRRHAAGGPVAVDRRRGWACAAGRRAEP